MRARGGPRRIAREAAPAGRFLLCAIVAIALLGGPAAGREEGSGRKGHRSQPARTGQAAPDRTGSITPAAPRPPEQSPPPVDASTDADRGPFVPILLPNAPRSRMIACGEAWRARKLAGTTGDDSWRDFAMVCLTAKEAP